jgi:dihydroxy-acid dehydratase
MTTQNKLRSALITEGLDRAPHRAFLRATGVDEADFGKPFIGIVSQHGDNTPCSMSLGAQADAARLGVAAGQAIPVPFTTISVSDGVDEPGGMRMSRFATVRRFVGRSCAHTPTTAWSA